jgi:hypothetical protein
MGLCCPNMLVQVPTLLSSGQSPCRPIYRPVRVTQGSEVACPAGKTPQTTVRDMSRAQPGPASRNVHAVNTVVHELDPWNERGPSPGVLNDDVDRENLLFKTNEVRRADIEEPEIVSPECERAVRRDLHLELLDEPAGLEPVSDVTPGR